MVKGSWTTSHRSCQIQLDSALEYESLGAGVGAEGVKCDSVGSHFLLAALIARSLHRMSSLLILELTILRPLELDRIKATW
jgi:hypothetical protein